MSELHKNHTTYIGLGTNLGDKVNNIRMAIQSINKSIGSVNAVSSLIETPPFGFESVNMFVNAVCRVQTEYLPHDLLTQLKQIEKEMGRTQKSVNGIYMDRVIDLDILLYDNIVLDDGNLQIPHPHLHKRDFVIQPLAEIAPDLIHPILWKKMKDLL